MDIGGEMMFDDMFGPQQPSERVQASEFQDEEEARTWLALRATASKADVTVALRHQALAQKAVQAVRRAVARLVAGSFAMQSLQRLGQRLSAHYGLQIVIRAATASAAPHNFSGNSRPHRFLVCYPVPGLEVIIDPAFRRQFELGASTPPYRTFLSSCVPEIFVGTAEMLSPLVAASASAAHVSFGRLGMPLPPWRCADKLLARWLPVHPQDVPCDALSAMADEHRSSRVQQPNGAAAAVDSAAAVAPKTPSISYFRPVSAVSKAAVVPWLVVVGFDTKTAGCSSAVAGTSQAERGSVPLATAMPANAPLDAIQPAAPSLCSVSSAPLPPPLQPPSSPACAALSPVLPAAAQPLASSSSQTVSLPTPPPSPAVVAASLRMLPPPSARLPAVHQSSANLVLLAKQRQAASQAAGAAAATSRSLPITSQFLAKTLNDVVAQTLKASGAPAWPLCRRSNATRFAVKPAVVGSLMPSLRLVQIGA